MDVERRSDQLFNSEISASFIGLPISNSRHMNQFISQKSRLTNPRKSKRNSNKQSGRTSTLEVLPKIETNKAISPETMTSAINQKSQSSNNNSSSIADKFARDLPISEAFSSSHVQEWLNMPAKADYLTSTHGTQYSNLSALSSESEDMLTCVDEFTDRTSVTSSEWGDDVCEFDKKESHRVNQMFEEIEWMLFNDSSSSSRSGSNKGNRSSSFSDRNGVNSGPIHLRHECGEWTHQFPHFRLVGHQVSVPQDQGYIFHESDSSGPITPKNSPRIVITDSSENPEFPGSRSITDTSDVEKISMVGYSVKLDEIQSYQSGEDGDLMSSQEEVFEVDGEVVEIIAIDYKMDDEDFNLSSQKKSRAHKSLFRSHKGFPPITPNAVMRDAVLTAVFDNLWSQVVEWILPLLSKMYQSYSSRDMLVMESSESSQVMNMGMSDLYRGQKPLSQITARSSSNLDDILKISTKTLQLREKSCLQSIPEQDQFTDKGTFTAKQPFALMNYSKKSSKTMSTVDRSQTPLSNHESSLMLDRDTKRTSLLNAPHFTSGSNAEHLSPLRCLRGKALYNCQSPEMLSRCGTLPPIQSRYQAGPQPRSTVSRISSAQMQDKHTQNISIGNISISNQLLMSPEFVTTRPGTSQTARSDHIGGNRSFTPTASRRSLNLNVHGSSMAMNSFSGKPSEELSYETLKQHSKSRPYWKIYNNPVPANSKRNKSLSNSVK